MDEIESRRERSEEAFEALGRLHAEVDTEAARLAARHADRLQCRRGCDGCCVDGISVFEIEAEWIRRHHAALLSAGTPDAVGRCAFLDERGWCRIYDDRPYVCRTQGLPLRWIDEDDGGSPVELRDICPLNESEAEPVERLSTDDCWTIGPYEERLGRLQRAFGGDPPRRVQLRDLFAR